jgi:predicted outer membrane protein
MITALQEVKMKRVSMIALAVSLTACGGSDNIGGVAATVTSTPDASTAQATATVPPGTPATPLAQAGATPAATPGATPAATPTAATPALPADTLPADAAATAFFVTAYQSGLAEIQLSQLAATRGENGKVREYAQQVLAHHTVVNGEIQKIAQAKQITLPTAVTQEQTADVTALTALSGLEFDRSYMALNVNAHQAAVAETMRTGAATNDDNVRVFSAAVLPILKTHLVFAEDILNQLDPAAFVATIYQSSQAELAWAQSALERATDAGVRQYAQKMVTEHTAANDRISSFAGDKELPLPSGLSQEQQAITEDLQRFSGADFDRAYMDVNVIAHLRATRYARSQMGSSGRDVDVRGLARELEPDLAGHLLNATELARLIEPSFVYRAYQSNLAELSLAYLAAARSTDSSVISYAQRMINEHLPVAAQLRQQAAATNTPLPVEVSPEAMLVFGTLLVIDDDLFNAGYTAYNTRLHDKAIELFSEETRTPDSTATQTFAQTLLPTLTSHRDEARTLRSRFALQVLQLIQRLPVFTGASTM